MAKRWASSRTRCSRYSPSPLRGRITGSGSPGTHLLQPLSQADHGDVGDTGVRRARTWLRSPEGRPVHDIEVGRVGETARSGAGRGIAFGLDTIGLGAVALDTIGLGAVADVAQETPSGHLRNGGDIVGMPFASRLPDAEVPVVRFARQAVLEHHQRAHDIGALDMADVDAFDAQWGLGEPEGLLDVLQRSRSRGEVTGPPQLVLSQGLLGIAMDGFARARLSPRCGTRTTTREPRNPDSHSDSSSTSGGRHGTRTSRGTGLTASSAAPFSSACSP